MNFVIVSQRFYGQPKLEKPKELKGLKQNFSVDFIPNKCKFGVWVVNNDVWVQCRDWFSSSFRCDCCIGTPSNVSRQKHFGKSVKERFIYADNWGDIVLRNEAWLKFEGVLENMRNWGDLRWQRIEWLPMEIGITAKMCRAMEKRLGFEEFELEVSDWSRSLEEIVKKVKFFLDK